ncbi:MAG: YXWGXW repeat-containing protein [Candidatus Acidiferrales bacterium]
MRARFIRALLLAVGTLLMSAASFAQVSVSVTIAPPELPVYEQPICPGDGYIWTPGYWAWDGDDYYWVPGTWIEPPEVGFLWTPGYWGWGGSAFFFHAGYWGPTIGFYGGVNYGFGYFGHGFDGGRWEGGHFFYNRAVANVNVTVIHNVYETRVNETRVTRVSYNGGHGGIDVRPSREEEAAEHERHVGAVEAQTRHVEEARANRELRASVNHGKPPITATSKPGDFKGHENGGAAPGHTKTAVHPKDLPPAEHRTPTSTGNAKTDQRYQQQQERLSQKQNQERDKLQAKQDQEHQRMQQQKATDARQQQVEQRHQQQTQQLQQRHEQQQQKMEQRQQPHQTSAPKEKR